MAPMPDVVSLWPEVFTGLTPQQTNDIVQVLASSYLEGHQPTRASAQRLAEVARGETSVEESIQAIKEHYQAETPR